MIQNQNTDTVLLDRMRSEKINSGRPQTTEAVNNRYELPSTAKVVRYLHAAAGFPPKATWLKAIHAGNYNTWPMITVQTVNKFFSKSKETQKGHM